MKSFSKVFFTSKRPVSVSTVLFLITLFLVSCKNPYSEFYNGALTQNQILNLRANSIPTDNPQIFTGKDINTDSINLMRGGFIQIGYSSFNAGNVDAKAAIDQARSVGAQVVVAYSSYTNTVNGNFQYESPVIETAQTNSRGSIYGNYGNYRSVNYNDTSTTTIVKSETRSIPYSVNRYDYYATYWIKAKHSLFGAHFSIVPQNTRQEIGSNKGVLVSVIVNDSPAFYADILEGDVISKINDSEIFNIENVTTLVSANKGVTINVELFRKGKKIVKQVLINRDDT